MSSEWQRAIVKLTAVFITIVIIAMLYWARSVFIPIAMAIFLAFVLGPPMTWLHRKGLGRTASVAVVMSALLLVSIGVGAVIVQQTVKLAETLPERKEAIKEKVVAAKAFVIGDGTSPFGELVDDVMSVIVPKPATPTVAVESPTASWTSQVGNFVSPAAEALGQAAFTFILTVFMLLKRQDLRNRMIRLVGDGKVTTTTKAVDDASKRISGYLLMQLMVNTAFGAVIMVGLYLLGVKYAILWGFIAALMRYVPYIGTWIGVIPAVLFSLAMSEGWWQPIAVFCLFIGLEMLCNNFIEPYLYGASMGLSEVAQLVAAAFWAFLWGPIGLILSGPLTVCLLVLGKYVRRFTFLEILLGDKPALTPMIAFYQRLAAHDQDEASSIALAMAKESGPVAAFDTVIVPALCLARRDHLEGDLDAADLRFAIRAAREIAVEIGETELLPDEPYHGERVRVLMIPAREEADHVAVDLFASLLNPEKWEIEVGGDEMLASELVERVTTTEPAVVVLAAIPPGGVSHLRYLVARLRTKCPQVKVVVGRWGADAAFPEPSSNEGMPGVDGIDMTLADTHKRLNEWHTVLVADAEKIDRHTENRELVGTADA